jgi:hypothetical protein
VKLMNKKLIILGLFVFLVAFAFQMSLFSSVKASGGDGQAVVFGTVTYASSTPLQGATVTISPTPNDGISVRTTNEAGAFGFAYNAPTTVSLSVSKPGYITEQVTGITLSLNDPVTRNFELHPLYSISLAPAVSTGPVGVTQFVTATVLDNAGAPVIGIGVRFEITSGPNTPPPGQGYWGGVTMANGQTSPFAFNSNNAGTDTVLAKIVPTGGSALEVAPFIATATVTWTPQLPVPESPFGIIGALFAMFGAASFIGLLKLRKRRA